MLARRLQRPGFFYGWVIVLVSFLIIAFVFGVRLSFGIFFDTLTRDSDFGWSRADTAGVFSVTMLVFAATSTSIGWLLDRWGPRRVYSAGILIVASGLWLTSRMTSLLDFYLFYGVWTGLGITVLGLSMHAATIAVGLTGWDGAGWPSAWPFPAAASASWRWRPSSSAPSRRPVGAPPM